MSFVRGLILVVAGLLLGLALAENYTFKTAANGQAIWKVNTITGSPELCFRRDGHIECVGED